MGGVQQTSPPSRRWCDSGSRLGFVPTMTGRSDIRLGSWTRSGTKGTSWVSPSTTARAISQVQSAFAWASCMPAGGLGAVRRVIRTESSSPAGLSTLYTFAIDLTVLSSLRLWRSPVVFTRPLRPWGSAIPAGNPEERSPCGCRRAGPQVSLLSRANLAHAGHGSDNSPCSQSAPQRWRSGTRTTDARYAEPLTRPGRTSAGKIRILCSHGPTPGAGRTDTARRLPPRRKRRVSNGH